VVDAVRVAVQAILEGLGVLAHIMQAASSFRQRARPKGTPVLGRLARRLREMLSQRLPHVGGLPRYRVRKENGCSSGHDAVLRELLRSFLGVSW
jgi:hypothetical protein